MTPASTTEKLKTCDMKESAESKDTMEGKGVDVNRIVKNSKETSR